MLKLSGEALAGDDRFGVNAAAVDDICSEIAAASRAGVQVGVVIGGGNFMRGAGMAAERGVDRVQADNMGMLATLINSLALQDSFERQGTGARVMSMIEAGRVAEPFERKRAISHLEKGRVVIFAGGTGSPFFSTDTAAALKASEINADCVLKATKVDGVYDKDPNKYPDAKLLREVSYMDALSRRLNVMDMTAFSFCMETGTRIIVFNVRERGSVKRILVDGERLGSVVSAGTA
jgi:uridylate kinase